MFWGKQDNPDETQSADSTQQQSIPREELPPQLQKLVDQEDTFYDDIYTPYSVDSTDTPYRYAGYANRIRTILLSAHRYVAYTSDIGESFRPVAHPYLVRAAYGISWTYVLGDVAHEGYKAYLRNRQVLAPPGEAYKDASGLSPESVSQSTAPDTGNGNGEGSSVSPRGGANTSAGAELAPWPTTRIPLLEDYRMVMAKRAIFQSLASMGLPALTIHSVVKYSGRMMKANKSVFVRTWGPIGLGLAVVPFLPYVFDEPVGEAVEWSFKTAIRAYAGEDAVRPLALALPSQPPPQTYTSPDSGETQQSTTAGSAAAAANLSWEEYKEERRKAKELRRQEREAQGQSGPLAWLGFKSDSKSKTE